MQLKLSRNEQSLGMLFKKKHYQIESQLVCNEEERMAIAELDIEKLLLNIDKYFIQHFILHFVSL